MSEERKGFDVAIVGGGVIGCAVARALSLAGARVAVVDRDRPGMGASWAAAGMLTPQGEGRAVGSFLELCTASLSLYPAFAEALLEETGVHVGYRPMETLVVALSVPEAERSAAALAQHHGRGARVEWLGPSAVRTLEPSLSEDVVGGLLFQDEAQVDNRALGRALWAAADRAGADVIVGQEVTGIETRAGVARGIVLADRVIGCDSVVVAAGAWSARLAGLPRPLPIRPVRGQMVAVEALPVPLARLLSAAHVYLVPRPGGRVLIGATIEHVGFRAHPTVAGIRGLLEGALRALPALAEAPVVETWAGLRPGTPDGLPILGPDPDVRGLFYATGHFRNGILLTPVTGAILARLIAEEGAGFDLGPYAPARFDEGSPTR